MIIPKEEALAWQPWTPTRFTKGGPGAMQTASTAVAGHPTEASLEREAARQEGWTQGHEAGYQAGLTAGREAGLVAVRNEAEALGNLLSGFREAAQAMDQAVAEDVLKLALLLAQQLMQQSLAVHPEKILPILREALLAQPGYGQHHAVLRLHPEDAGLVRDELGEQLPHGGWKLIEDPAIHRGGCRVEAAGAEVDATVETRWRRLLEGLGHDTSWLADDATP